MPAWRNRASEAISEVAKEPVCEEAARDPAGLLPLLTTMMGFVVETLLAKRAKVRGLPKDSR
jgi:hypothetical protein